MIQSLPTDCWQRFRPSDSTIPKKRRRGRGIFPRLAAKQPAVVGNLAEESSSEFATVFQPYGGSASWRLDYPAKKLQERTVFRIEDLVTIEEEKRVVGLHS